MNSYANKFLTTYGQQAYLERVPSSTIYISMIKATRSTRDLSVRDAYYEGIANIESGMVSGDIFDLYSEKYLVQSVYYAPAAKEIAFMCAKTNAVIDVYRPKETVDSKYNLVESWTKTQTGLVVYNDIITYTQHPYDVGVLEGTKYIIQIPSSVAIENKDRVVFYGRNVQTMVISIDDIGLPGIWRVQLAMDTR